MFGFKIQSVESLKEKFKGDKEKRWKKIKENKGGKSGRMGRWRKVVG